MVQNQLKGSRGLVEYSMKTQILGKKAWTLSVWEDEAALQDFVQKTPHAEVMRKYHGSTTRQLNGRSPVPKNEAEHSFVSEEVIQY